MKPLNYLALGDSYTIGEGLPSNEGYPVQLTAALKEHGLDFSPPTIIAKTGWTAGELRRGIASAGIEGRKYDLVTLLIGVNNQYRGESLNEFETDFSALLDQAIAFADRDPRRVIVISIPDWGVTPFALEGGKDRDKVAVEIDLFNRSIQSMTAGFNIFYLDITDDYRRTGGQSQSLVADQLHPSGTIYKTWAARLKDLIISGMDFRIR